MKSPLELSIAAGMGFQQRLTTRICLGRADGLSYSARDSRIRFISAFSTLRRPSIDP